MHDHASGCAASGKQSAREQKCHAAELLCDFSRISNLGVVSAASAFSERYLGSPRANPRVYEVNFLFLAASHSHTHPLTLHTLARFLLFLSQMSSLAQRAGQLEDKNFLIIHPTADGEWAVSSSSRSFTFEIKEIT